MFFYFISKVDAYKSNKVIWNSKLLQGGRGGEAEKWHVLFEWPLKVPLRTDDLSEGK